MEMDDGAPPPPRRAVPWVEKYRPRSIGDVSAQGEVVRSLTSAITSRQIPHLLFYGPPGTGKTSTILAVARDLFGPELMRSRVMELNASDERGIAVVREKVKHFAQSSVGSSVGVAPFKLIILDEADSLTADAQAALRRTIETYSKVTRFCIICNYVSRIIDPLASRCSKFRFKPLDTASMLARLQHICSEEKIDASEETLLEVLRISAGDLRKAITFLQSASDLYGRRVTPANVVEISGVFPDKLLAETVRCAKTSGFDGVKRQAQNIILGGYSVLGVLERLTEALIADPDVKPHAKALIAERAAAADKRLVDGADEELQLLDVLLAANRAIRGLAASADKERVLIC